MGCKTTTVHYCDLCGKTFDVINPLHLSKVQKIEIPGSVYTDICEYCNDDILKNGVHANALINIDEAIITIEKANY